MKVVYWVLWGVLISILIFLWSYSSSGFCYCNNPTVVSFRGTHMFSPDPCSNTETPCHVYLVLGKKYIDSGYCPFSHGKKIG